MAEMLVFKNPILTIAFCIFFFFLHESRYCTIVLFVRCRLGEYPASYYTVATFHGDHPKNEASTLDITDLLETHNQKLNTALAKFQQVRTTDLIQQCCPQVVGWRWDISPPTHVICATYFCIFYSIPMSNCIKN